MISRLQPGDSIEFAVSDGEKATHIEGIVRERDTYKGNYIRVTVNSPSTHPNITLVVDDGVGTPITAYQDYKWDSIGHVVKITTVIEGFEATIQVC